VQGGTAVTLREVNETDLNGLLKLYTELHSNAMPECGEKPAGIWAEILGNKNHHIIVAEEEGRIVSSCTLLIVPNLTHAQRPYALIENVITATDFRRRGLASACMDHAKDIAVRADCYKIMLMTGSKQESVLTFYERAGYNREDKTAFIQWLNP
jgi:ribosomal protein S18 acetylase RimI-like enzyme